ncbi:MAG: porphobilinogen synthase [Cytophagaceae bacterium]|nr:porphobilinogen synthase [Cytophagaceae bacterium]
MKLELPRRPRRNRKSAVIRDLVREHEVTASDLIFPMFLTAGQSIQHPIASMPGIFRFSEDLLLNEIEACMNLGLKSFALFPHLEDSFKDSMATISYNKNNIYLKAIRTIKKHFPECVLMTDVALDPYSSDGHDGIVKNGKIINDETIDVLCKMSLAQAEAGADILGPSDMMDGRIGEIRSVLEEAGFSETSIMSYSAKYASAFYGPFREALDSAPKNGDKKTYQMDPANQAEALVEAELDYDEGADFLMVKPALAYLDVIKLLYDNFEIPIAAYQVSGEYAMVKAAAANGWLDEVKVRNEMLTCIKRSGAKIILSYFAKDFAAWKKNQ